MDSENIRPDASQPAFSRVFGLFCRNRISVKGPMGVYRVFFSISLFISRVIRLIPQNVAFLLRPYDYLSMPETWNLPVAGQLDEPLVFLN